MISAGVAQSGEYGPVGPRTATHITVALIPRVAEELRRTGERSRLSRTDIVNRAITLYEFIDGEMRKGNDLLIRDRRTKETQLVRFL